MDIKALARASYDPSRFGTAYAGEKRALREAAGDAYAAQDAKFGSVAANNDPTKFGSAARARFGNVFNPDAQAAPAGGLKPPGNPPGQAANPAAPTAYEEMMGNISSLGPTTMAPPWLPGTERPNPLDVAAYKPFKAYTQPTSIGSLARTSTFPPRPIGGR